jgi:23S rRNA (adenine2030-N6)-methyltransferase
MNYRHAFHAGNFADVHKHAVLAHILRYLHGKPAAFRVIDTHAGAGRYDLLAAEACRSGEWRGGIGRVYAGPRQSAHAFLTPYLDVVAAFNPDGTLRTYPGSPLIARSLLRTQDRLIACEAEPHAAAALAASLRGDRRAKALAIDGWTALGAFLPPKERRGLVLIDPPFEQADEFTRLAGAVAAAHRKWPTGIYMLWYPMTERAGPVAPAALARRLQRLSIANVLRCELTVGSPRGQGGMVGSGLIVVNPPFTLEPDLRTLMPALSRMLSPAAASRIDWLAEPQ